jgi:hypothetical protein
MRYLIDAWLDEGDPRIRITDADSGTVRLQWIYHRTHHRSDTELGCSEVPPCAGCSALHCLVNHLFLLACSGKLSPRAESVPDITQHVSKVSEQNGVSRRRPGGS